MAELTDESPMPWGKHKGKPMKDVPIDYLNWLWWQGGYLSDPVFAYIQRNLPALRKENDDLIWHDRPGKPIKL